MSKLVQTLAICAVTALAASGVAACSGDNTRSGGGGKEGGDITVTMTSFPDYVDPQLSYTVQGWEVLWNVYTPLLTYKHARGKAGTEVVPGLAKDMPQISDDGKTYKLTLRPNMKYSDGTPIKASDFTYAIQRLFKTDSGGSVFYEDIVGATDYADGKADKISGIRTDDDTGDITIQLDEPQRYFQQRARPDVRRSRAANDITGQRCDEHAAAGQRAIHHQQGRRSADADDGTQPAIPHC